MIHGSYSSGSHPQVLFSLPPLQIDDMADPMSLLKIINIRFSFQSRFHVFVNTPQGR